MKVITFSSLYPSTSRPFHATFVETRLKQLLQLGGVESIVVAPVAWSPFRRKLFGRFAALAATPAHHHRDEIQTFYPKFLPVPGLQGALKPLFMAVAAIPVLNRLRASGYAFELIDAHYFYPDGVAAAILARHYRVPFVITARGSDLNLHAKRALPRRLILWAARRATTVITVSNALREVAVGVGIEPTKIKVLPNGVDSEVFRPLDRAKIRSGLGLTGFVLISVGNLVPEKGHHLTIRALTMIPDAVLFVGGEGPEREHLANVARAAGVFSRVKFLGAIPQVKLVEYYNAADALVLASSREGWPNVLLEAMACGTPVIASDVGGCSEVVSSPDAGLLFGSRTPEAIAKTVSLLRERAPERERTRKYAEHHNWNATSKGQLCVFGAACRGTPRPSTTPGTSECMRM